MTNSLMSPLAQPSLPHEAAPKSPHRHASWGVVALIALATAAGGVALGTRLQRFTGSSGPDSANATAPGVVSTTPSPPPGAGPKAVYVSTERQQLVGVRTGSVVRQHLEGTLRTEGVLAYDETHTTQVHTRVSGWVEQLAVDFVGKPVKRGQALFSVLSFDLVTAQGDYLVALRAQQRATSGPLAELKTGADALVSASRDRLNLWGVSDGQIAELERTGHPSRTVTLASPFDGVVLEKNVFEGQYVTPEMSTFKLADLSTVWVIGQLFEYEAARIHPGDTIDVVFPYGQAKTREARVDFIYPEVDPQTRRVRFRALLKNADHELKPDTYVTLVWHGEPTDALVVPKDAVIDTGERKYVLLALANGYFEPRDVTVSALVGDSYPVLSGVAEGDQVVTSAQFLIDSETNLMSAMQNMAATMPGMEMGQKPAAGTAPAATTMAPMPGMPPPAHIAPHPSSAPIAQPSTAPVPPAAHPTVPAPMPSDMPDMPGMPGMRAP